jgi:hypothetical protein
LSRDTDFSTSWGEGAESGPVAVVCATLDFLTLKLVAVRAGFRDDPRTASAA